MAAYRYRGHSFPVAADIAFNELEKIKKKHGKLTSQNVWSDVKKNKSHKLKDCFEWDKEKAFDTHNRKIASTLIREIEIIQDESPPMRVYYSLQSEEGENFSEYADFSEVMTDKEIFNQVRIRLLQQLSSAKNSLDELMQIGAKKKAANQIKIKFEEAEKLLESM